MFVGNHLTGLLDFYTACCDFYLLDIAIALNDWCVNEQGVFDRKRQDLFMRSYRQTRRVNRQEEETLQPLLRRASLRFWLSRLEHRLSPKSGELTQDKDPELFRNLLVQHRDYHELYA